MLSVAAELWVSVALLGLDFLFVLFIIGYIRHRIRSKKKRKLAVKNNEASTQTPRRQDR